jgi:hypothetical protein
MKTKKIEKHIVHCLTEFRICERKNNNLKSYYFRKQLEVALKKLNKLKKLK